MSEFTDDVYAMKFPKGFVGLIQRHHRSRAAFSALAECSYKLLELVVEPLQRMTFVGHTCQLGIVTVCCHRSSCINQKMENVRHD